MLKEPRLASFMHRMTSEIVVVSQAKFLPSRFSPLYYLDSLNNFKDAEIHREIFDNCDAGKYKTLTWSKLTSSNDKNLGQEIFDDKYVDNGLVLSAVNAMPILSCYLLDSSANASVVPLTTLVGKNKGPKKNNPAHSGRLLAQFIRENRFYQLSLYIWSRIAEFDRRYQTLLNGKEMNCEFVEQYSDLIQKLLQNVLSAMYIDKKLGLGCMIGLPPNKAFDSFKVLIRSSSEARVNIDFRKKKKKK